MGILLELKKKFAFMGTLLVVGKLLKRGTSNGENRVHVHIVCRMELFLQKEVMCVLHFANFMRGEISI